MEFNWYKRQTFRVGVLLDTAHDAKELVVHDDGWQIRVNDDKGGVVLITGPGTNSDRQPDFRSAVGWVESALRRQFE